MIEALEVEDLDAEAAHVAVDLEATHGVLDAEADAWKVASVVDEVEAMEAAEAEVEAILREDVLRRALLDPEGEARERRKARAQRLRGSLRWNFAGRSLKVANDRFREHEAKREMCSWGL